MDDTEPIGAAIQSATTSAAGQWSITPVDETLTYAVKVFINSSVRWLYGNQEAQLKSLQVWEEMVTRGTFRRRNYISPVIFNRTLTLAEDGKMFLVSASSSAKTITLPTLGGADAGYEVSIAKFDSSANDVVVTHSSGVGGETEVVLSSQHSMATVRWTGTDYVLVGTPAPEDLTGASIVTLLAALTGTNRLGYSSIKDTPSVLTGANIVTLLAALTSGNRLSYDNLKDRVNGVDVVTLLSALTGTNRLSYNDLQDLPGDAVSLTGDDVVDLLEALTGDARLSYNDLQDLPGDAVSLTGADVVGLLAALAGSARLSYNSLRNTPGGGTIRTLLEGLTAGNRLSYNSLDDLPGDVTSLTGDDVVVLLDALTAGDRLSYESLKDALTGGDIVTLLAALSSGNRLSYSNLDDALTGANIVSLLAALTSGNRLSYDSLKNTPAAVTGTNIVTLLAALTGGARLSYNDLQDLPGDVASLTGADVVGLLDALTGSNRLSYDSLDDTLTGPNIVSLLAALSGNDRLSYNSLRSTPNGTFIKALLEALPEGSRLSYNFLDDTPDATSGDGASLTGAEIVTLLAALTGTARLNYSSLQGVPTGANIVTLLAALTSTNRLSYDSLKDTPTNLTRRQRFVVAPTAIARSTDSGITHRQNPVNEDYEVVFADGINKFGLPQGLYATDDYGGGNITFKIHWHADETSGDVRWRVSALGVSVGDDVKVKIIGSHNRGVATGSVGSSANELVIMELTWSSNLPSAGDALRVKLERVGNHSADTLAANAYVTLLVVEYDE